jgi:hypothetical protein
MRPLHISNNQIKLWEQALSDSKLVPAAFKESEALKEFMFAVFWLQENLRLLNCSDQLSTQIQFTHGYLSHQRDAWEVAAELLEAFKKDELGILVDAEIVAEEMANMMTPKSRSLITVEKVEEHTSLVEETAEEHPVDPKLLN